jgi:hypothetical protein
MILQIQDEGPVVVVVVNEKKTGRKKYMGN